MLLLLLVTSLVGLALEMRSLDTGFGDDFEDFDLGGFSFRLFGFFSVTRLSQGSEEMKKWVHVQSITHYLLSLLLENGLESSESDEEFSESDPLPAATASSSLSLLDTAESLPSDEDVSVDEEQYSLIKHSLYTE